MYRYVSFEKITQFFFFHFLSLWYLIIEILARKHIKGKIPSAMVLMARTIMVSPWQYLLIFMKS